MGLLAWFKKRGDKEDVLLKVNETLKSSFTNVRKDILHIHKTVSDHTDHTSKKFQEIEDKIKKLEITFLSMNYQKPARLIKEITNDEAEEVYDEDNLLKVLKGIPRAELKLFRTLYELQLSLNAKHISYKSLASYLYPGKDYSSIRSTITQFILRLHTEGLIEKQRIGKEAYVRLTPQGLKLVKNTRIKKIIKETEAQN